MDFSRHGSGQIETIKVAAPPGIRVSPAEVVLDFTENEILRQAFHIRLTAEGKEQQGGILKFADAKGPIVQYRRISYQHIPVVTWFPPLEIKVEPIEIQVPVQRVAYIPGAGDLIPEALRSLGIQVDEINPSSVNLTTLAPYDAVVVGVRAYNIHPQLYALQPVFQQYMEQGGVFLVQYQVSSRLSADKIGPFPFQVGRSRVTEEDADVTFLLPNDPSLHFPNRITEEDFAGWVQERGLYFVENAHQAYALPLAMSDQGEKQHPGSVMTAEVGSGKFVYTSLSFFRQLPGGVPGAHRLFINLLANEKKNH